MLTPDITPWSYPSKTIPRPATREILMNQILSDQDRKMVTLHGNYSRIDHILPVERHLGCHTSAMKSRDEMGPRGNESEGRCICLNSDGLRIERRMSLEHLGIYGHAPG